MVSLTHICPEVLEAGWKLEPSLQIPMSEPTWLPGIAFHPFGLSPCAQLRVTTGHLPQWLSAHHQCRMSLCRQFHAEQLLWYITSGQVLWQGVKWKKRASVVSEAAHRSFLFCQGFEPNPVSLTTTNKVL